MRPRRVVHPPGDMAGWPGRVLREALAQGQSASWDFAAADELERHCLRADKVYSKWAYQDILGYRYPGADE